jgi:hypothetical protein
MPKYEKGGFHKFFNYLTMKKIFATVLILVATMIYSDVAFSQVITGKYKRRIDKTLDGNVTGNFDDFGLKITSSSSNSFRAVYWGIDNDAFFEGEIYGDKLVKIHQNNEDSYFGVFAGIISGNGNRIKGTWYDNKGNSGDFEFVRQ